MTYLVETLADAYAVFEQRVASERRGQKKLSKQERVRIHVLDYAPRTFSVDMLRHALPGISDQTIRLVLAAMRQEGLIQSDDKGRSATWTRLTSRPRA